MEESKFSILTRKGISLLKATASINCMRMGNFYTAEHRTYITLSAMIYAQLFNNPCM